jgi:propanediol utilization protein
MTKISVEVSARHCHLSQSDLEKLFGKGYKLKQFKKISQLGQFAAKEEIKILGPKGELKIRIVGPVRQQTQIELAITDCYKLGLKTVLRSSGLVKSTPGAILIASKKRIKIKNGVIVAMRHLHLAPAEAKSLKLKNGQLVSVRIAGPRGLIFNNVIIRVAKGYRKSFQIDTDEANACSWMPGMKGELIE